MMMVIRLRLALILAAGTTTVAALSLAPPGLAARSAVVTRGLDYLHAVQRSDGRFQDPAFTPWGVLAIAASGEDPTGSAWGGAGKSPVGYLESLDLDAHATQGATGNAPAYYAKMILAYVAAGRRASLKAAGRGRTDLVAKLLSFRRGDGRFSPAPTAPGIAAVNTTTWAIIALCAAQAESSVRADAVAWLRGQQLPDGGFSSNARDSGSSAVSDVDDTAAAIQALVAGGTDVKHRTLTDARAYLKSAQRPDGGFSSSRNGGYTYSESTAWAIQAILALGENPQSSAWSIRGNTPHSALAQLQTASGAFSHRKGTLALPILSTTQSLVAANGRSFASWPRGGGTWVRPFAAAPRVTRLAPAHGSVQSSRKISVRAAYQDPAGGTGVKASGVRLTVDGHDMTRKARITDSSLSVNLTGAALGAHKITLRVADRAGNVRSVTHTVTVGRSGGANEEPAGVAGEGGRAAGSDDVVRGEADGRAEGHRLGSPQAQQRPAAVVAHAGEPVEARSAQQVEQHRLGLVVALMPHRNARRPHLARHAQQERVAHLARGFFHAQAVRARDLAHVRPPHRDRQLPAERRAAHEFRVRCARRATRRRRSGSSPPAGAVRRRNGGSTAKRNTTTSQA